MMSVFDVIGPPMVGPSSSHTAGVCRLGLMARYLLGEEPHQAVIGLHGSLAATGIGHATDRALAAGLLGFAPDDHRLKDALDLAPAKGLKVEFGAVDLGEAAHPNTAQLQLCGNTRTVAIVGASVGGGAILVTEIDNFGVALSGGLESVVLWHGDVPGFLAGVASLCAYAGLNIAATRTVRGERGAEALTTLEVDGIFPLDVLSVLGRGAAVRQMAHLPVLPGF